VDVYRNVAGVPGSANPGADASLAAGVLWYQLFFALAKLLGRRSTSEKRNWSAPREARLLEVMRFFAADLPSQWRSLVPKN
jgi:hypothetical protein